MVDPWDDFRRFEETMNRMIESFWGMPHRRLLPGGRLLPSGQRGAIVPAQYQEPSIDVVENEKEIIATAEMPGLEKEDIKINLTEDRLEISAETKKEEKKEEKGYVYRERRTENYFRGISLPSSVDTDNSKASYNNGILEIKMPKKEVKEKKPLNIE